MWGRISHSGQVQTAVAIWLFSLSLGMFLFRSSNDWWDGDCRNISFVIHIRNGTSDSKDSRDPQKSKKIQHLEKWLYFIRKIKIGEKG